MRKLDIDGTVRNLALHCPDLEEMGVDPAILEMMGDAVDNYDSVSIHRVFLEDLLRTAFFLYQNPSMIEFYE